MSKEKDLENLLLKADIEYKDRFGYDKEISRDYFKQHYLSKSSYEYQDVLNIWGTFTVFKDTLKYKRKELDIKKSDINKKGKRKYFITSYITGSFINEKCFETIQTFCKKEKAELVLIVMRGTYVRESMSREYYEKYNKYFCTEYMINTNLLVKEFFLNPQQIDPTFGLNHYGNKVYSIIVGSPKQTLRMIPSKHGELPHLIYSPGTICDVDYQKSKSGIISEHDHVYGGLVVEVKNKRIFHVRNIQFDKEYGFYNLTKYYQGKKVKTTKKTSIVWGDVHFGMEDKKAVDASIKMTKILNSENIVIHDLVNAASVLRHNRKDMISRLHREEYEKVLELELDYVGNNLQKLSKMFKNSTVYIVSSNHDRHINDYLSRREWIEDEQNFVLSCELFLELEKGNNPTEYYIRKYFKIDNVVFLKQDDNLIIEGFQCGRHGDQGNTGAKGNIKSLEIAFPCSIIGNYHAPGIYRQIFQVGCLCKLDPEYSVGYASASLHANTVIYPNQTRQMILIINGEYCI